MKAIAALLFFFMALAPHPAAACSALTPRGQQRQAEGQARFLEGYRTVDGRWQFESEEELAGGDLLGSGSIFVRWGRHETGRTMRAYYHVEINCGFPSSPGNGEMGRFYLHRVSRDSWRIVHFQPDPVQPAPAADGQETER